MKLIVLLCFMVCSSLQASSFSIHTFNGVTIIKLKNTEQSVSIDNQEPFKCACGELPVLIICRINNESVAYCQKCLKEKNEQSLHEKDDGSDLEGYPI